MSILKHSYLFGIFYVGSFPLLISHGKQNLESLGQTEGMAVATGLYLGLLFFFIPSIFYFIFQIKPTSVIGRISTGLIAAPLAIYMAACIGFYIMWFPAFIKCIF